MASETEILRLALMAYEAATEPAVWPGFLKRFTEAVSGDLSVLQIHDVGGHNSVILSGFGLSSPFTQSYNQHYSTLNVWRERGQALYTTGRINLGEELCPRPVLERSEFYNDYMLRIGGAYTMGAVIAREGNCAPTLTALRGPGKHQFGESEREVARFVLPHLSRAWSIQQRLGMLSAGEAVLDTLPLGIVFLSGEAAAVYCNRAAEEIFRANDGLSLRNRRISAGDRIAQAQIRRAIREAVSPRASLSPAAVSIPRAHLRRDYQLLAAPLRQRFRQLKGVAEPATVVLITDPERQTPANGDLLIQTYKLTRKEAMFATKLYEGKSVEKAAEELSITYETARTHLRRIFSKTRTSRQAELLLLIAKIPAIHSEA